MNRRKLKAVAAVLAGILLPVAVVAADVESEVRDF